MKWCNESCAKLGGQNPSFIYDFSEIVSSTWNLILKYTWGLPQPSWKYQNLTYQHVTDRSSQIEQILKGEAKKKTNNFIQIEF